MDRTESTMNRDRKAEHIELALDRRMQLDARAFDIWRFEHEALPEISMDDLDTSIQFLDKTISAPLLISCMTGGTEEATRINRVLAEAAEEFGIPFGVGSQRKAIEDPSLFPSFDVRPYAPTVPILANLGAVQLNYGFGLDECRKAVEQVGADALVFHLNPLQEAIQPEGQTDFRFLADKIQQVASRIEVPVIIKEIGCGLSEATGRKLTESGIRWFDTAGTGGTSWARIEGARADDVPRGEIFADWGISTPDSILALKKIPGALVIGSGGLRNGVDVAKAIALGAELAGMAYPFLAAAREGIDAVRQTLVRSLDEMRICMFCTGARTIAELQRVPLQRRDAGDDRA